MWNNRVHKIYPSSEKTLSYTLRYDLYSNVSEDGHNFRTRLDFLAFSYAVCIYISIPSLVTFHPCGNDIQLLDATTDEVHWLLHGSCPFFSGILQNPRECHILYGKWTNSPQNLPKFSSGVENVQYKFPLEFFNRFSSHV